MDTLPLEKGIDVRAELLNFHKRFYSSNIMALSVLGKGGAIVEYIIKLYYMTRKIREP